MKLNERQSEAVGFGDGHVLVNAGPGTGKTRTLTARCAKLLERGVEPERILLVTFTKKAAAEMIERMVPQVGAKLVKRLWSGTFHSVCVRLMRRVIHPNYLEGRRRNFAIYDEDDQCGVIKSSLSSLGLATERAADDKHKPPEVQKWISLCKCSGMRPENFDPQSPRDKDYRKIWFDYEQKLVTSNAFDFEDLLSIVLRAAEQRNADGSRLRAMFDQVLVDEYQDTNGVQHRMVCALAEGGYAFAVGDPRQAIYGFRGADYDNILHFPTDFDPCEVITLDRCYRCAPSIMDGCNSLIGSDEMSAPLPPIESVVTTGGDAAIMGCSDEQAEAKFVVDEIAGILRRGTYRPEGLAVLYRKHALSSAFEDGLNRAGIQYELARGRHFYERKDIKDVMAYLRLVAIPDSDVDFRRASSMCRGVGPGALACIEQEAAIGRSCLWVACERVLGRRGTLTSVQRRGLTSFFEVVRAIRMASGTLSERVEQLVSASGLRRALADKLARAKSEQDRDRLENRMMLFDRLVEAVRGYEQRANEPSIEGYLDEVALVSDQDAAQGGKVRLSTIHAAKGLEFDAVWIVGFEQNILPVARSKGDKRQWAEERRLAYVAMSRARQRLRMSYADMRYMFGRTEVHGPSELLLELAERLGERLLWLGRQPHIQPRDASFGGPALYT